MQSERITICACSSRPFIDREKVIRLAAVLSNAGRQVMVVPDLCKLAMQKRPEVATIASSVVIACYPRAVRSLFRSAGFEPVQVLDMRSCTACEVLAGLACDIPAEGEPVPGEDIIREELASFPVEQGTDAWFPVIDKDRCSECGQCHDFCLFGVYAVEDGKVKVEQPQQCKNNCPACARICPSKAIIFPKYEKPPVNGGVAEDEPVQPVDVKTLYADALRMRLEQRKTGISLLRKDNK